MNTTQRFARHFPIAASSQRGADWQSAVSQAGSLRTLRLSAHSGTSRRLCLTSSPAGFTFTELLVVIATLVILTMLVFPALAASRTNSHAFQCLDNMKRLQLGSQLYANDNNDTLPGNLPLDYQGLYFGNVPPSGVYPSWVAGTMGTSPTSPPESGAYDSPPGCSTNASFLGVYGNKVIGPNVGTLIGSIGGYVKSAGCYKCPADKTIDSGYKIPRVRDCSANFYVGVSSQWVADSGGSPLFLNRSYKFFFKYSDFGPKLSAAQCFVFLDESPLSCNDGFYLYNADGSHLNDLPAVNHGNSSSFSFADGHAELHQWVDSVLSRNYSVGTADPQWLATHGTYLLSPAH